MGTAPAGSGYTIDTSTPGVVKLLVSYVPFGGTVIDAGSRWKYFVPSSAISSTWTHIGFDDRAWPEGNTEIGYGDGGEPTEINVTSGKPPAIYARHRFTATANDLAYISALTLHLLRDDGAVVYLNGIEIRRDNMPAGPVSWNTYASASVASTDETTFFPSTVDPSLLNIGENVLAVEIHQRDAASTDISFNLSLVPVAGDRDTDDDGLMDAWEQRYFGSLAQNGLADADGDGLSNFAEMKTRTSPVSAADALRLARITMPAAGQVQLAWNTLPGVMYQVRQSDDLSVWTDASASMHGDGNAAVFNAPMEAGTTRRFYQIFLP